MSPSPSPFRNVIRIDSARLHAALPCPSPRAWAIAASLTTLAAVVTTLLVGAQGDYGAYVLQWDLVLSGDDPWSTNNTYGPAYNLFSILYALHPMLPKVLFAAAWQVSSWYVLHWLARRGVTLPWLMFWLAALPLNPLFWVFPVVFGQADALVAALCLVSLACRQADRNSLAAVALALAVLMKVYPIVFAPFLALDGRRVNLRFLMTFVAMIAIGLAFSLLLWGESTFHAITFNSGRGSTILSIFRFLRGDASPLQAWADNVDYLSIPAMALGGGLVFALAWKWRIPHVSGALAGILVTLTFWKVGYHQYFLVVPLTAGLMYASGQLFDRDKFLDIATVSCIGWMGFVSVLYLPTYAPSLVAFFAGSGLADGMAEWLTFTREWVGLPTFAVLLSMLAALMRHERRRSLESQVR